MPSWPLLSGWNNQFWPAVATCAMPTRNAHQPNLGYIPWLDSHGDYRYSSVSVPHSNKSSCLPCPRGSYADAPGGFTTCTLCPHSAMSPIGSATCTCIGANRIFRQKEGCVCRANHEAFDATLSRVSGGTDSRLDCQPIVFERCHPTRELRLGNGTCVGAEESDRECDRHCRETRSEHFEEILEGDPLAGGKMSRLTGHCLCTWDHHAGDSVVAASTLSEKSAAFPHAGLPSAFVDGHGDYVVRMADGTEVERVSAAFSSSWSTSQLRRMIGDCPRARLGGTDCRIVLVHTNSRGLNMAALGSALSLKDGPGLAKLQMWKRQTLQRSASVPGEKKARNLGLKFQSGEKESTGSRLPRDRYLLRLQTIRPSCLHSSVSTPVKRLCSHSLTIPGPFL